VLIAAILGNVFAQEVVMEKPPWWAAVSSFHFPQLFATDIEDFVPQLQNASADYVLIDFYAPWCPHCQHFAPDFERLSLAIQRFDNSRPNGGSGKPSILSATVDCVRFYSTCDFWGVHSYPTLMWGRREDWLKKAEKAAAQSDADNTDSDSSPPPTEESSPTSAIESIDNDGTADSVAQWINNRTQSRLDLSNISKREIVSMLWHDRSSTKRVSAPAAAQPAEVWDAQLAVALLLRDIFEHHAFEQEDHEVKKRSRSDRRRHIRPQAKSASTTRGAFMDFVALLGKRFPETANDGGRCRASMVELHDQLTNNWAGMTQEITTVDTMNKVKKLVQIDPDWLEQQWQLCGEDWSRFAEGWHQCKGTWPGKRGFTCGLWNLFHFLAADTDDSSALADLQTMRSTIAHFFDCQECRDHMLQIPVNEAAVKTRGDAQLWWWNAHNVVNRRVGKLEQQYDDGDPAFPKVQWPAAEQCPNCRRLPASAEVRSSKRLVRLRGVREAEKSGKTAEVVTATGTPQMVQISEQTPQAQSDDVPVEFVTLADAIAQEQWDLDEVRIFLGKYYRTAASSM
jgi:thiol oxidase